MSRKGRPAGSITRTCLIKDKLILPYEIHIDETTGSYLKVVAESQSTVGYYASLAHLIKSISKELMNMEPRRLVNIHKICIVKHASNVCYMRPFNISKPDSTKQANNIYPLIYNVKLIDKKKNTL